MARTGWKQAVLDFIEANGPSLALAARGCGISYSAISKEKGQNPAYAEAIEAARQKYWDDLEQTTIAKCKRETSAKSLLKLLELRHPDYKKKSQVEFEGTITVNLFDNID